MKSLTELNTYTTDTTLTYTDQRIPRVLFDRITPTNQTIVVNEGSTFATPVGIEITDVIEYTSSTPYYEIDVSSQAGVSVSWSVVPTGCTVSNPSTGVYRISGVNSAVIWNQVRLANISLEQQAPNGFVGTFAYTATIAYTDGSLGAQTRSWTVAVSVLDVTILTNPSEITYATSDTTAITNFPQIIDLDSSYPSATWTVAITPSSTAAIDTITCAVSNAATFNFNAGTKVTTIAGTRANVNQRLANLVLASTATEIDFNLSYQATNNQDAAIDTKTQLLRNINVIYLSNPSLFTYYTEDTLGSITGAPQITDEGYTGSGTYTLTLTPDSAANVYTMASTGSGGTSSFNASTRVLTISGTKTQVNERLNNLTLQPESDIDITFTVTYFLTTPESNTSTKIQQFICNSNDQEVSNLGAARSYVSNNANTIFSSDTPQIVDLDTTGSDTYTVVLSSDYGDWTYVDGTETVLANPMSISGNRATVNSKIAGIKFYPDAGVSTTVTATWTQLKNGVQQLATNFIMTGTVGTYSGARTETFLATANWTPTKLDVKYGEIEEITLVGGGGGGAHGGGGGGQVKYSDTVISLSDQTYTITVGAGGLANQSGNANNGGNTTAFAITALGGGGGGFITNFSPLSGGTGGYSYAPDGTQYAGGAASVVYDTATVYMGGGGAGSGGRLSIFETDPFHIDAPTNYNQINFGRHGGIGYYADLGGVVYGAGSSSYNDAPNFGFGGGGGRFMTASGGGGGVGGYRDVVTDVFYSSGANRYFDSSDGTPNFTQASLAAQDSPRTAAVAGGGGGGGAPTDTALAPAKNGGDGIVIFRIGTK